MNFKSDALSGLGKHNQGIVDAIKPKLKFDSTGVGHNRWEIFGSE